MSEIHERDWWKVARVGDRLCYHFKHGVVRVWSCALPSYDKKLERLIKTQEEMRLRGDI